MINALHLLWIIPISATFGVFLTCIIVGGTANDRDDIYDELDLNEHN